MQRRLNEIITHYLRGSARTTFNIEMNGINFVQLQRHQSNAINLDVYHVIVYGCTFIVVDTSFMLAQFVGEA
jgi:hypothetical protein